MSNKEIVDRLIKVHKMLDEMSQTIDAIDVAMFDLAIQFADEEDFPDLDLEGMREEMSMIKKMLNDDCEPDDYKPGEVEDIVDFLERCLDGYDEIKVGDKVMITNSSGVHYNDPSWVFENIEDKELIVKYAYGVKPNAKETFMVVVGKDDDGKCFYLLDEEKDECYIVDGDYIVKYIPKSELLEAIKAG